MKFLPKSATVDLPNRNISEPSLVRREVLLTPYVKWFLEKCGKTDSARHLCKDICCALEGTLKKDGIVLHSARTFLLFIAEPVSPGGPERVVVWHGPSDGSPLFNPTYLEDVLDKALPYGIDFT